MEQPLVFENTLNASREKVWSALTNPDEMKQWYFDIPGFRPEVGFEFSFSGGPAEDRQYVHLCRVTEVAPGKLLAHSWRYAGYPGDSEVRFELSDAGEGRTHLRLTHSGLETIEPHHADFARSNFNEGWTWFTQKALPEYLSK